MRKTYWKVALLLILAVLAIVFAEMFDKKEDVVLPVVTPTPKVSNAQSVEKISLKINEKASIFGVSITPLQVIEDSRCPEDVQCIQAGTVRVKVLLASSMGESEQVFGLGKTITTEAETITLVEVNPQKISTKTVLPEEYRFVFEITKQ